MKLSLLTVSLISSISLYAGECTYSFAAVKNEGAQDITVPLALKEGRGGFTYEGFAAADGSDLRIKDSQGNLLAYEIDNWNVNGLSVVWVRVPELTRNTVLSLSWGNVDAPAATSSPWPSSSIVMHFNGEQPALSSPSAVALSNFSEAQSEAAGPVGSARKFYGTPSKPRLHASSMELPVDSISAFTVSFWWKADKIGDGNQYLFQLHADSPVRELTFFLNNGKSLCPYSQGHSGDVLNQVNADVEDYSWHHYAIVYDGANMSAYKDGLLVKGPKAVSTTIAATIDGKPSKWKMTFGSSKTPGAPAQGEMDEFRLDFSAKDSACIRAECELQELVNIEANEITVAYPDCAVEAQNPLQDFPLFVPVRAVDGGCSSVDYFISQLVGGNVQALSADGSEKYPCEIEYAYGDKFNVAGLWVKVPSFSRETVLKVRPGSSHYTPQSEAAGNESDIWNKSEYVFVNHISPVGGRPDSVRGINFRPTTKSPNPKPGTDWSLYSPAANGPTGPYAAMNCGTTTVAHASSVVIEGMSLTNVFTVSWWMRQDDFDTVERKDGPQYIIFMEPAADSSQRSIMLGGGNGEHTIYLAGKGGTHVGSGIYVPDGKWHHYAYVSDGTTLYKFLDGAQYGTGNAFDFNMPTICKTICLGNSAAGAQHGVAGLRGGLDEFRVENVARSAQWIAAMYTTQRAYVDGVGYGYAPEFADVADAQEVGSAFEFMAKLSCRTKASCYFCYGSSDAGDERTAWENTIDLGEKGNGAISASVDAVPDTAVYGRFFAENDRGRDMTRTVFVRRNSADKYRCPINVAYQGAEVLVDFPVMVSFPSSIPLPSTSKSLSILDADGKSLPFEVECWNPQAASIVWVRIKRLEADTQLLATWSFGKSQTEPWQAADVWSDDYKYVGHFDAEGAALSDVEAKDFNDFAEGFTIALWAKIEPSERHQRLAAFSSISSSHVLCIDYAANGEDALSLGMEGFGFYLTPMGGTTGGFDAALGASAFAQKSVIARNGGEGYHHYAWTSDGKCFKTYFDGQLVSSQLLPMTLGSGIAGDRRMGASFGGSGEIAFSGLVDEVRVVKKARSARFIAAHCENMAGSMVTLGDVVRPGLEILVK